MIATRHIVFSDSFLIGIWNLFDLGLVYHAFEMPNCFLIKIKIC